ncbi:unnamed protein product [Caenorhabditis bovis]|uniref:Saposin B-type domain-containing protein n=1 Tax=Caenorhabditis bovis TaxID=2654633 RepID=A0A8S1EFE1_9PELO|nr:unnamed protein product [Caenorhabditis bovis]
MGCTFRARLNQLSSIWYTVIVTLLQAYLLYLGFERYRLYNEIKWPTGGYPHNWLKVYIIVYASCIPATLLFFAFGFFKSGNIAGDNEQLANREERIMEVSRNRNGEKSGCVHRLKVLWQHLPPLPQFLHLLTAISQLVAQQLLFSQLFRHGFVNSGDFLNTEMDFLFHRARQLATNLPIGETRLQGFRITADELAGLPVSPNLLPVLMHLKLFGIPLEFFNFLLALVAFGIAYPSVFWRVSKPFSVIFSFYMLIYSVQLVFGYLSFSVLFRIQETNIHSMRPVGLGQYLGPIRILNFPVYHPLMILGSFLARFAVSTLAVTAVYAYGYNKYHANIGNVLNRNAARSSAGQSDYGEYRKRANLRDKQKLACDGYLPHINSIFFLVLISASIGPMIYAMLILHQHEQKAFLLTAIIVDVLFLFSQIFVWLGLTLKRDWDFRVTHKANQIYGLQKGMATGTICGNENPSQLKNSILLIHKDTMYVTDDQNAKQSLLRAIHTGKFESLVPQEDAYYKPNQMSPQFRAKHLAEAGDVQNSPETARLLHMLNDDSVQTMSYHSNVRSTPGNGQSQNSQLINRNNGSPPSNKFGTIQRNQQYGNYSMGTLQRNHSGTIQRSAIIHEQTPTWNQYASIQKENSGIQNNSENQYGRIDNGTYGGYARVPQSRIQVTPQNGQIRINGYGTQGTLQRREITPQQQQVLNSVRQSPLLSERSSMPAAPQTMNTREQSPYQRSAIKLTSFAEGKSGSGIYGTTGINTSNQSVHWGNSQQRAPPGQPNQLIWSGSQNKSSLTGTTNSSQNDEQCFTPTSTITSHGSNYTPTPGSPQKNAIYSRINGSNSSNLYGSVGEEFSDRTLQKNPIKSATVASGTTSIRHTVKINGASENSSDFSLRSSLNNTMRTLLCIFALVALASCIVLPRQQDNAMGCLMCEIAVKAAENPADRDAKAVEKKFDAACKKEFGKIPFADHACENYANSKIDPIIKELEGGTAPQDVCKKLKEC